MPSVSLTQAETQLAAYLAAETAVLGGQSYAIGARSLTRANLKEIREGIAYWNAQVKELENSVSGYRRARTVAPNW